VRAAAVGLSLATLVASGCSATHARPPVKPSPAALAPANSSRPNATVKGLSAAAVEDGYAGLMLHCRAHIADHRLTAPFWLQFDHFDPSRGSAKHTPAEVERLYRTSPQLQTFHHHRVHVAFADYSDLNGDARPTVPVWIVVSYLERGPSLGLFSKPRRVDAVSIIRDSDLRRSNTIETLPSRCR
jgi:hypothetical protein